ncbi:MAG: hypothetical protein HYS07_11285 [Chlamydiae bacterium]|nr:hypothetical protein [Chlamydiota bacterium]MBI3278203.1 hypothetical protein [Chlamydiota bacterium]
MKFIQKWTSFILSFSLLFYDVSPTLAQRSGIITPKNASHSDIKGPINLSENYLGNFIDQFRIPNNLGEVIENNLLPNHPNFFIVEDIHCNPEAQKNIRGILKILQRQLEVKAERQLEAGSSRLEAKTKEQTEKAENQSFPLSSSSLQPRASSQNGLETLTTSQDFKPFYIFCEAASGEMDLSFFTAFPDKEALARATEKFLQKSDMDGVESFLVTEGPEKAEGVGVEDLKAYVKNIEYMGDFIEERELQEHVWQNLEMDFRKLREKIYSKDIRELMEKREKYREFKIGMGEYLNQISKIKDQNDKSNIKNSKNPAMFFPASQLPIYPAIQRFLKLQSLEGKTDLSKAEQEYLKFLETLEKKLPQEKSALILRHVLECRLGRESDQDHYIFLSQYVHLVQASEIPNLKLLFRQMKILKKLSWKDLEEEIHQVEKELTTVLTNTEQEKNLVALEGHYEILKRIVSLEGKREDIKKLETRGSKLEAKTEKEEVFTSSLEPRASSQASQTSFIGDFLQRLADITEKEAIDYESPDFGDLFEKAEKFYSQVLDRDEIFMKNALRVLQEKKLSYAALVMGGFHTSGVKEALKEAHIGYCVIAPRMTHSDDRSVYYRKMKELFEVLGGMDDGLKNASFSTLKKIALHHFMTQAQAMGRVMVEEARILPKGFFDAWESKAQDLSSVIEALERSHPESGTVSGGEFTLQTLLDLTELSAPELRTLLQDNQVRPFLERYIEKLLALSGHAGKDWRVLLGNEEEPPQFPPSGGGIMSALRNSGAGNWMVLFALLPWLWMTACKGNAEKSSDSSGRAPPISTPVQASAPLDLPPLPGSEPSVSPENTAPTLNLFAIPSESSNQTTIPIDLAVESSLAAINSLLESDESFRWYFAMGDTLEKGIEKEIPLFTGLYQLREKGDDSIIESAIDALDLAPLYAKLVKEDLAKLSPKEKMGLISFLRAVSDPRSTYEEIEKFRQEVAKKYTDNAAFAITCRTVFEGSFRHAFQYGGGSNYFYRLLELLDKDEKLKSLREKYSTQFSRFSILLDYLKGSRDWSSEVEEAFGNFESDYSQIKTDFKTVYPELRKLTQNKLLSKLASIMDKISYDDLTKFFTSRQIKISFRNFTDERFKKLYLMVAFNAMRNLPPERIQGVTMVFDGGNGIDGSYSNDEGNDLMIIALQEYFDALPSREGKVILPISVVYHEFGHRWHSRFINSRMRQEMEGISWIVTVEESRGGAYDKNGRYDPYRDSIGYLGSIEASFRKEDIAETVARVATDYERSVNKAIDNLIQYNDPDLAQKIFFAYAYLGRVPSQNLWIVRVDGAPLNQEAGTYVFKQNGKIRQIKLRNESEGSNTITQDIEIKKINDPYSYVQAWVTKTTDHEGHGGVISALKGWILQRMPSWSSHYDTRVTPILETILFGLPLLVTALLGVDPTWSLGINLLSWTLFILPRHQGGRGVAVLVALSSFALTSLPLYLNLSMIFLPFFVLGVILIHTGINKADEEKRMRPVWAAMIFILGLPLYSLLPTAHRQNSVTIEVSPLPPPTIIRKGTSLKGEEGETPGSLIPDLNDSEPSDQQPTTADTLDEEKKERDEEELPKLVKTYFDDEHRRHLVVEVPKIYDDISTDEYPYLRVKGLNLGVRNIHIWAEALAGDQVIFETQFFCNKMFCDRYYPLPEGYRVDQVIVTIDGVKMAEWTFFDGELVTEMGMSFDVGGGKTEEVNEEEKGALPVETPSGGVIPALKRFMFKHILSPEQAVLYDTRIAPKLEEGLFILPTLLAMIVVFNISWDREAINPFLWVSCINAISRLIFVFFHPRGERRYPVMIAFFSFILTTSTLGLEPNLGFTAHMNLILMAISYLSGFPLDPFNNTQTSLIGLIFMRMLALMLIGIDALVIVSVLAAMLIHKKINRRARPYFEKFIKRFNTQYHPQRRFEYFVAYEELNRFFYLTLTNALKQFAEENHLGENELNPLYHAVADALIAARHPELIGRDQQFLSPTLILLEAWGVLSRSEGKSRITPESVDDVTSELEKSSFSGRVKISLHQDPREAQLIKPAKGLEEEKSRPLPKTLSALLTPSTVGGNLFQIAEAKDFPIATAYLLLRKKLREIQSHLLKDSFTQETQGKEASLLTISDFALVEKNQEGLRLEEIIQQVPGFAKPIVTDLNRTEGKLREALIKLGTHPDEVHLISLKGEKNPGEALIEKVKALWKEEHPGQDLDFRTVRFLGHQDHKREFKTVMQRHGVKDAYGDDLAVVFAIACGDREAIRTAFEKLGMNSRQIDQLLAGSGDLKPIPVLASMKNQLERFRKTAEITRLSM